MTDDSHDKLDSGVIEMENQELAKEYEKIERRMAVIIDEVRIRREGERCQRDDLPDLTGEFSEDKLSYTHTFDLL